ncbi:MAG: restriction endonuclease subunit S [Chloroflexi bacterium]|nr:restriction endonuclease subunit S [Chloroflexota bacterium]MCY3958701.1 restriction endonuclease subunit S [Chloroflexota bacterium]
MNASTSPVDIRIDHLEAVQCILRKHLPAGVMVSVFGSRANWTSKDSSDLDLAVQGTAAIDHETMARLEIAFEESDLPYTVDVVDLNRIGESFRQIVESQRTLLPMDADGNKPMPTTGWHEVTLGNFAPFAYGKGLRSDDRISSGDVPVIGSNGIIGYHDKPLTDGPTIVIGRKGTVGAVYYSPAPCWPIDTTFYITGADSGLLRFRYYVLKSLPLQEMNADSAVPGLNRNDAHACLVRVPVESEQRAIAHVLGTLDDKIELNRRMSHTLDAMARALFKSWFVDFDPVRAKAALKQQALRHDAASVGGPRAASATPAGEWTTERAHAYLDAMDAQIVDLFPDRLVPSEIGEIPEKWEVKAVGELVEFAYGRALRAVDRKDGSVPVYGSNGQVGWHDKKLVAGPGIVVGRKGNPGVVTWAHGDFFPIDTTFYVVPRDDNGGLPFLYFALTGQDLPSVSADSAVPGLNRNLAYMNKQLVPDKRVIAKFSDHAGAIFFRRHRLALESQSLAEQRDALLPQLVSGDLSSGRNPKSGRNTA